jgi:hypothetical protein
MNGGRRPYELVFVDDGSRDGSLEILKEAARSRPDRIRVLELARNFGQHQALLAAFQHVDGDVVVTLDADLQNPPEEIPKLLDKFVQGFDVVGGVRQGRQDTLFRRMASGAVNRVTAVITRMKLTDFGCMLRAYSRDVVEEINRCHEASTFIPALAQSFARRPAEVPVAHAPRRHGTSAYSLYRLIRLNFDLMTGFSLVPLQLFGLLGRRSRSEDRVRHLPLRAPADRGRRGGGRVHAVRHPVHAPRRRDGRTGPRRRVRRAHLPAGPRSPAFPRQARLRTRRLRPTRSPKTGTGTVLPGMTRIAVFAYSDTGHACLKRLLERGRRPILVATHRDSADEARWFPSVAELARAHGIEPIVMENPLDAQSIARVRTAAPDLLFSFYYRRVLPKER